MPKSNVKSDESVKKKQQQQSRSTNVRDRPPQRRVEEGNLVRVEYREPRPPPTPTPPETVVADFIPGTATPIPLSPPPPPLLERQLVMGLRMREMDRLIQEEEDRMTRTAMNPNAMVSLYARMVYMNCGHRTPSHISNIRLGTFILCSECVSFKRVTEVVY